VLPILLFRNSGNDESCISWQRRGKDEIVMNTKNICGNKDLLRII